MVSENMLKNLWMGTEQLKREARAKALVFNVSLRDPLLRALVGLFS